MHKTLIRTFWFGFAVLVMAQPVVAQSSRFWYVCGGSNFSTCAAVQIGVATNASGASDVTMRVWNLSGANSTASSTVFTWIGFHGTGVSGVSAASNTVASMTASTAGTVGSPTGWYIGGAPSRAGGNLGVGLASNSSSGNSSVDNSIANQCDASNNPGGSNSLWLNPCWDPNTQNLNSYTPGYVTLRFQTNGVWDLANVELIIQGQNGLLGDSTQCITGGGNCSVVPEPVTMILLGTGLLGTGAFARRKRRLQDLV